MAIKKVYTVTRRGENKEHPRLYKRKYDATRHATIYQGYITEYQLIKVADYIKINDTYIKRTEEAILLYE